MRAVLVRQFGGDVDYKNWHPLPSSIQYTGFPTADGDVPADAGKSFLVAWDPVISCMPTRAPITASFTPRKDVV